jgi:transposase
MHRDARKLKPEAQYEVRRQAVRYSEQGLSYRKIASLLEVDKNTVGRWIQTYKREGLKALKPQKRGPKEGVHTKLTKQQQKSIRRKIIDKTPEQYKMPFALWSREAVTELIEQDTGLMLDRRLVGEYLKRWGFTPQRPAKQAYRRSDKKVKEWLEHEYPSIETKAKKENAQIHWADEAGVKSHDHRGRGYSLKGQTPIRKHNPIVEKVNMISSITNQGELKWMCYEESFTYQVFHRFLKRLIQEAQGRKLIIILDNLRVHHSKVIKRWVRRYSNLIELRFLPSYCPDLNPDEYLNCDLKTELSKRPEKREKGNWRPTVESCLLELERNPARVESYFQAKSIQYAARKSA